jgi:hypothetical protein
VGDHARDQDAAAAAVDNAAAQGNGGRSSAWITGSGGSAKLVEAGSLGPEEEGSRAARGPRAASRFIGVTWRERIQRWEVRASFVLWCVMLSYAVLATGLLLAVHAAVAAEDMVHAGVRKGCHAWTATASVCPCASLGLSAVRVLLPQCVDQCVDHTPYGVLSCALLPCVPAIRS